MNEKVTSALTLDPFSEVSDPRANNARHLLNEIFFISICAVLCGAESWEDIELYGKSKSSWLTEFLQLPHGIPSDDTYRRVFTALKTEEFENAFQSWVQNLVGSFGVDVIPIDGKTLRHSFDKAFSKSAIHMVSAFSVSHQLVLGQVKIDDKSNEITAIPQLLELLDISNSIVTLDAMGTQKKIARQIIDPHGDYVLALKENHETLYQEVSLYLQDAKTKIQQNPELFYETVDGAHGRIETRRYYITSDLDWIEDKPLWKRLSSIGMVESLREVKHSSREFRYSLNSIPSDVKRFAFAVRNHWAIENSLHWTLDVSFREDDSRICKENAPQNFSLLRKIAWNILKNDKTSKGSLKGKRKKVGWNNQFLLDLLQQANFQMR